MDITNLMVAIDLGSSNIVGMAGVREGNKIKIVAIDKEPSEGAVRRGCVINIEESASKVKKLITKLENKLSTHISNIFVGIGGQSVRTIKNNVSRHLPDGTKISSLLLEELQKEGRNIPIASTEIIDVLPNEIFINDNVVKNPEGVEAKKIQIDMQLAVARQTLTKNIVTIFDKLKLNIEGFILSSKADAEAVLKMEDKESGCVLVNFGGGTTEVSIYHQGFLRQLTTIPLGGKNITQDIMSLGLVSDEAERFKISLGSALLSTGEQLKGYTLDAQGKGPIKPKDLNRITVARIEEIVANVVNQIKESGYKSELKGGIIITGEASQLKDLPELLRKEAGMEVRCGTMSDKIIAEQDLNIQLTTYSQTIGMLLIANESLASPTKEANKEGWWPWKKAKKEEKKKEEVKPVEAPKPKPEKVKKEQPQEKREGLFDTIQKQVIKYMTEDNNEKIS
ncbi:MAG: cell division protein FtsA [Bacteroidales bacterium]|nr:cell division protein FtsA [Bacteroidales bacterium]